MTRTLTLLAVLIAAVSAQADEIKLWYDKPAVNRMNGVAFTML